MENGRREAWGTTKRGRSFVLARARSVCTAIARSDCTRCPDWPRSSCNSLPPRSENREIDSGTRSRATLTDSVRESTLHRKFLLTNGVSQDRRIAVEADVVPTLSRSSRVCEFCSFIASFCALLFLVCKPLFFGVPFLPFLHLATCFSVCRIVTATFAGTHITEDSLAGAHSTTRCL